MSRPLRQKPLKSLRNLARPPGTAPAADFERRVAREGTVPLPPGPGRVPPPRSIPGPKRPAEPVPAPVFHVESAEEFLEGYREGLPAARRRSQGQPSLTLDLHGLDTRAARREVLRFVAHARRRGHRLVLLIVGKGLRSPGGHAVLRAEVADWLSLPPAAHDVLAFRTAPREHGGTGGILVLLARPSG